MIGSLFQLPDLSSKIDLSILACHGSFCIPFSALKVPFMNASGGLLSYSKFAQNVNFGPQIPSKLSMVVLYSPAAIYAASKAFGPVALEGRADLVSKFLVVHFGKRVAESLLLHKYSGGTPLTFPILGLMVYMLWTASAIHYASLVPSSLLQDWTASLGIGMCVVGILGNLYHHYLLATLRKPGEKGYKVPQGGLFSLVACPHYFFELVGWAGMTIASQHSMCIANMCAMTVYLCDRARQQTIWNQSKLDDYPKERKHILPFIF